MVKYIPGKTNGLADALSRFRLEDLQEESENASTEAGYWGMFQHSKWTSSPWYHQIYETLNDLGSVSSLAVGERRKRLKKAANFFLDDNGQLWHRGPKGCVECLTEAEVMGILVEYHESVVGGHYGRDATLTKIGSRFYWPTMYGDVDKFVKSCENCQRFGTVIRKNPLHPYAPLAPFDMVFIDWVVELPRTAKGNGNLIVALEPLTHYEEASAYGRATAKNSAHFLWSVICARYSMPAVVIVDNHGHFKGEFEQLCNKLGIKIRHVSPYRPQGNLVERSNGNLMGRIKVWIDKHGLEWDQFLTEALWASRSRIIGKYNMSPMQMLFGFEPRSPDDNRRSTVTAEQTDAALALMDNYEHPARMLIIGALRDTIIETTRCIAVQSKKLYDKKVKQRDFDAGDRILVFDGPMLKSYGRKLRPRWVGPFTVIDVGDKGVVRYNNGKEVKTVSVDYIKKYHDRRAFMDKIQQRVAAAEVNASYLANRHVLDGNASGILHSQEGDCLRV